MAGGSGTSFVAGAVRARAMARRCVGPATARRLATAGGLDAAVEALRRTPYGHDVRAGQTLSEVQAAVAATLLWHLRVLAGWLPGRGVEPLRAVAGWYEISNTDQLLRRLGGRPSAAPFRPGPRGETRARRPSTPCCSGCACRGRSASRRCPRSVPGRPERSR